MKLEINNCQYIKISYRPIITILIFSFFSCNGEHKQLPTDQVMEKDTLPVINTGEKAIVTNFEFIGDSLLHGYSDRIKFYFEKYKNDTCKSEKYLNSDLVREFEGIKKVGVINNDKISDSVFVLPPLNQCEIGQSYYFSDTSIPRILTESNCCHPENIFIVGDIDEDGIFEIGEYFSSCTSKYKSLHVYSLKNEKWKEIGHCVFDLDYSKEKIDYTPYVKKTHKNEFEMLEITDLTKDKSKVGKKNWLKFTM